MYPSSISLQLASKATAVELGLFGSHDMHIVGFFGPRMENNFQVDTLNSTASARMDVKIYVEVLGWNWVNFMGNLLSC